MRILRILWKDRHSFAAVVQERKEGQGMAYNERMKTLMGGLEGERGGQK